MNPYEWSEYEAEDHFCEVCGCLISTNEYLETGMCEDCFMEFADEEGVII